MKSLILAIVLVGRASVILTLGDVVSYNAYGDGRNYWLNNIRKQTPKIPTLLNRAVGSKSAIQSLTFDNRKGKLSIPVRPVAMLVGKVPNLVMPSPSPLPPVLPVINRTLPKNHSIPQNRPVPQSPPVKKIKTPPKPKTR